MNLREKILGLGLFALASSAALAQPTVEPGGRPQDIQLALTNPDEYAWQLFFYISHQAQAGKAGVPDPTKKSIREFDPDRAVVWETWALASGAVLARKDGAIVVSTNKSEVYKKPATLPDEWDKLDRSGPKPPLTANFKKLAPLFDLTSRPSIRDLVVLAAPAGVPGDQEEVRMNRSTFDTVRSNKLYSVEGIESAAAKAKTAGTTSIVQFEGAAKEVKAQWLLLPNCVPDQPCPDKERYHWRTIVNPETNKAEVFGLVSLHVITKDLPNWFWADFGHIDCETGKGACAPTGDNPDGFKADPDNVLRDSTTRGPNGTGAGPSGTDGVRTETLKSKWENYRLRGTQIEFTTSEGRPLILSNPVIESSFQRSSCMTCHSFATAAIKGTAPDGGTSLARRAQLDYVRNIGSSPTPQIDIGAPNCLKFFNQVTGACPAAGTAPLYFQTDFLWSMAMRPFSEKP